MIITGDPRHIVRAGLVGTKTCTRPTEGKRHCTVWPLYAEAGFRGVQALQKIVLADAAELGIDRERVHIEFSNFNMEDKPLLRASLFPTYNEGFDRSNEPAHVSTAA